MPVGRKCPSAFITSETRAAPKWMWCSNQKAGSLALRSKLPPLSPLPISRGCAYCNRPEANVLRQALCFTTAMLSSPLVQGFMPCPLLVFGRALDGLHRRRPENDGNRGLFLRFIGYIGLTLHFVAFVDRDQTRRIISLRKANRKEVNRYAEA